MLVTASKEVEYPSIPKDLLDRLDTQYPEKAPDPKDTEREVWMKAGERRVVRKLLIEFKRQHGG